MERYDVTDMQKCKYIEHMCKQNYFEKPKQESGRCMGFINKYSKNPSFICNECNFYIGTQYD